MMRPAVLVLAFALPAAAEDIVLTPMPDLPEPTRMGALAGTWGSKKVGWEIFDFSVGAPSADATFIEDWEQAGLIRFYLIGHPKGAPEAERNRLYVKALLSPEAFKALGPGSTFPLAEIALSMGEALDEAKITARQPGRMILDRFRMPKTGNYGEVWGRIIGELCNPGCRPLELAFSTEVYFYDLSEYRP